MKGKRTEKRGRKRRKEGKVWRRNGRWKTGRRWGGRRQGGKLRQKGRTQNIEELKKNHYMNRQLCSASEWIFPGVTELGSPQMSQLSGEETQVP